MFAGSVTQSPFSLAGFGFAAAPADTAGIANPQLAASLAQISTSLDVRAALAAPDSSPAVTPSVDELLHPVAPTPPPAQTVVFGSAVAGYASSPGALLPVAALLFDNFA